MMTIRPGPHIRPFYQERMRKAKVINLNASIVTDLAEIMIQDLIRDENSKSLRAVQRQNIESD